MAILTTNLRNQIELLALWWVPAAILGILSTFYYTDQFGNLMDGWDSGAGVKEFMAVQLLAIVIDKIDELVVCVWLFIQIRRDGLGRPWLWMILGAIAGLIAVLVYLGIRIHEDCRSGDA